MSDADHSRDDRRTPGGSGGLPPRDPMEDTMPWSFDDDPVAEQLRAWRSELGPDTYATPDHQPASLPTEVHRVAPEPTPTPAPRPAPVPTPTAVEPQQTPATPIPVAVEPQPPVRHQRIPENSVAPPTAPWPLSGFVRRRPEPEIIDVAVRQRPPAMPQGRHAAWDVISTEPARALRTQPRAPQVPRAEAANAAARTVAFPALDLVPTASDDATVEYAIEAQGLRKVFKDMVAVDDVSFKVPKGKIIALLGPNGAGKTTTVNMLCTLLRPDGGSATVNGYDVVGNAASVRRSIMLTGQFAALDESLTGRENLVLFGRLLGLTKKAAKKRALELLETFELVAAADKKVGQYSGGMRRRIDIACGLVTQPTVVFLDEPTTGLDPRSRQEVWSLVEKLREDGVTVLLTTQYLEEADMLSDRIVVIDKGRVIAEGTSDELKSATGAAYCEITPAHIAYLPRLRGKLADMLGPGGGDIDEEAGTLAVPAPEGPATLAEVIRRTEAAQIPLADIALRRPSLDEVFLALTGTSGSDDERSVDGED